MQLNEDTIWEIYSYMSYDEMTKCRRINKAFDSAFISFASKLRDIDISCSSNITDNQLLAISRYSPDLQRILMDRSRNLSEAHKTCHEIFQNNLSFKCLSFNKNPIRREYIMNKEILRLVNRSCNVIEKSSKLLTYGTINVTGEFLFAVSRIYNVCRALHLDHTLIPIQSCIVLKLICSDNHYKQLVEDGRSIDHVIICIIYDCSKINSFFVTFNELLTIFNNIILIDVENDGLFEDETVITDFNKVYMHFNPSKNINKLNYILENESKSNSISPLSIPSLRGGEGKGDDDDRNWEEDSVVLVPMVTKLQSVQVSKKEDLKSYFQHSKSAPSLLHPKKEIERGRSLSDDLYGEICAPPLMLHRSDTIMPSDITSRPILWNEKEDSLFGGRGEITMMSNNNNNNKEKKGTYDSNVSHSSTLTSQAFSPSLSSLPPPAAPIYHTSDFDNIEAFYSHVYSIHMASHRYDDVIIATSSIRV